MIKNISDIVGTLGKTFVSHAGEMNNLRSNSDIHSFLEKIDGELSEDGRKYLNQNVKSQIEKMGYQKSYSYLYNILLAGYSGCKIGEKRRRF